MERKQTHFKMYKIGRRWVFACATVLTLGLTRLGRGRIQPRPTLIRPLQPQPVRRLISQ